MTTATKTIETRLIPVDTKVYKTLANCCKHQYVRPAGVAVVFSTLTKDACGFARLPEKIDGVYIKWVK